MLTGDTAPCDVTQAVARGADLLVHEATFPRRGRSTARGETGHSTARQAAELAARGRGAAAGPHARLAALPGRELREEARAVFERTIVPRDFDRVEIPFPERGEPRHVRASADVDGEA